MLTCSVFQDLMQMLRQMKGEAPPEEEKPEEQEEEKVDDVEEFEDPLTPGSNFTYHMLLLVSRVI